MRILFSIMNDSYAWDESLTNLSHSIGWFTCELSVYVYNNISFGKDVYILKEKI